MSLNKALRDLLLAEPGVTSLVQDRIKPQFVPQDMAYPAVTYTRIDTVREVSHDSPLGLRNARYQFDVWDVTPDSVEAISEALIAALSGFRGTSNGVQIGGIIPLDEREGPYEPGSKLFRRSIDFSVWAHE